MRTFSSILTFCLVVTAGRAALADDGLRDAAPAPPPPATAVQGLGHDLTRNHSTPALIVGSMMTAVGSLGAFGGTLSLVYSDSWLGTPKDATMGAALLAGGLASLAVGIPLIVVGGRQVPVAPGDDARAVRRGWTAEIVPAGRGVAFRATF